MTVDERKVTIGELRGRWTQNRKMVIAEEETSEGREEVGDSQGRRREVNANEL